MEVNWNFQRGGEVLRKIPSVGRYEYFLELHILRAKLEENCEIWETDTGTGYVCEHMIVCAYIVFVQWRIFCLLSFHYFLQHVGP